MTVCHMAQSYPFYRGHFHKRLPIFHFVEGAFPQEPTFFHFIEEKKGWEKQNAPQHRKKKHNPGQSRQDRNSTVQTRSTLGESRTY